VLGRGLQVEFGDNVSGWHGYLVSVTPGGHRQHNDLLMRPLSMRRARAVRA
jgi:hypothetical protein